MCVWVRTGGADEDAGEHVDVAQAEPKVEEHQGQETAEHAVAHDRPADHLLTAPQATLSPKEVLGLPIKGLREKLGRYQQRRRRRGLGADVGAENVARDQRRHGHALGRTC